MIVDFHTQFYPYRYLDELRKGGGYAALEQESSGRYIIRYTGDYNILTPPLVLLEERLPEMKRAGVDLQVLSLTTPGVEREEPARGVKLAKITNDSFADIESKNPSRFRALATLPMQDPQEAADELACAYRDLGLRGAMVSSNIAGKPVLRLILGGLADRYPRLKLGASHLGGVYPFLRGRVDLGFDVYPECGVKISKPPSEYLKEVWVDTCGYDDDVIAFVLRWLGSKKMLLGSDYPAQIADPRAVDRIRPLKMRDDEREDILWKNAARLLGPITPRAGRTYLNMF